MTQTYKMKHNLQGTVYSLLTVESDGQMTLTFYGRDREISHEVTENEDGWLCYPGGTFPGLASGKWQLMEADNEQRTHTDVSDVATPELTMEVTNVTAAAEKVEVTEPAEQTEVTVATTEGTETLMLAQCVERFTRENSSALIHNENIPQPSPQPKRQRKPRKPMATALRRNVITESRYNDTTKLKSDNDWLRSAGYLAAASVALLVIWQTGLIIPLGLIGLATSGFLK